MNRGIRSYVLTHTWGGSVITQKFATCLNLEHVNSRAILGDCYPQQINNHMHVFKSSHEKISQLN